MLLQSLVLIAAIVVVSASIMTSMLVSAKSSLHNTTAALTQTAMNMALADFSAWAASEVQKQNSQAVWPKTFTTEFRPMCPASTAQCSNYMLAKWIVTGATTVGGASAGAGAVVRPHIAIATNLAAPIDEQRISATIAIDVDDATGRQRKASATREMTARLFDAKPFVAITGVRDSSANNGTDSSSEGDSGGNPAVAGVKPTQPKSSYPSDYVDTRLATSVECVNSKVASNQRDPFNDPGVVMQYVRGYGNLSWSFEAPCVPLYPVPPTNAVGYIVPTNATYSTVDGSNASDPWTKGDQSAGFRN